jgi:hypothetical protein
VGTPGRHASTSTRDGALGVPVGSHVGKRDGQATTGSRSAALGLPLGVSMGTQARPASTTGTAATAPIPHRDTGGRTQACQGKRKSPQPDGVVGPPPVTCQLNAVYDESGQRSQVLDQDIGIAVQWGATCDCLLTRGYTLDRISSHSLRAGGAMAMKLSGASNSTIMRVGRWSSLTYLTYIHLQISALTAGLSKLMATQVRLQNVG